MIKLLSISIIGFLFAIGNPIGNPKISKPPTAAEARKLNHSNKRYEVFLSPEGEVEYRDYELQRKKGLELPFKLAKKDNDPLSFRGKQVNLKIESGWLVGFDRGEWGGDLFWFNEKGDEHQKITTGNIQNLFKIDDKVYVTEGLAHLSLSLGKIFTVELVDGKWAIDKKVDLPSAPHATTLMEGNEILIVTSQELLKVDRNFNIEILINEGFWWGLLYPNSILTEEQNIYIGMRGGILRTQINDCDKQEWLTEN